MNIALTPEIECALTTEADRQGTTPELLALDALHERFVARGENGVSPLPTGTMAEYLSGHVGALSSGKFVAGGANLSVDSGRKFTSVLRASRQKQ